MLLARKIGPAFSLALVVGPVACGEPAEPDGVSAGGTTAISETSGDGGSSSGTGGTGPTGPEPTTTTDTDASGGAATTGDPEATVGAGSSSGTTGEDPNDPCPRVRVLVPPTDTLNVRPTPSTEMAAIGALANGTIVDVVAIVQGEALDGSDVWYEIAGPKVDGFVFGGLVECTQDVVPTVGFLLPLSCGTTTAISQGNFGGLSHQGQSAYAFDFQLGLDTPLVAIEAGTVSHLFAGTLPGDPCYQGGGMECISKANFVTIAHEDGTASIYAHLNAVMVAAGQPVARGAVIGRSGSTGWSTGPHAHVARQDGCGLSHCPSIAVQFADVADDGVPETGDNVTSQNCP